MAEALIMECDTINIKIRGERPTDYNEIANLSYNSFINWHNTEYKSEPIITAALRHNQYYDPELSIVAELDNKIVGHAFFSTFPYIVMGEPRKGVYLAPLSVDIHMQKQGIGGALIEAGHDIARNKGISLALLCGHKDYYPRFGYENEMFALSGTKLFICVDHINVDGISERQVKSSDLQWIKDVWKDIHGNNRLALYPGDNISQWFNHSLIYRSSVLVKGDRVLGYIRYRNTYPIEVKEILPIDGNGAEMLAYVMKNKFKKVAGEILLSLCFEDAWRIFEGSQNIKLEEQIKTNASLMLKVLDEKDEVLKQYCREAVLSEKNLGVIAFPTVLDIDD